VNVSFTKAVELKLTCETTTAAPSLSVKANVVSSKVITSSSFVTTSLLNTTATEFGSNAVADSISQKFTAASKQSTVARNGA